MMMAMDVMMTMMMRLLIMMLVGDGEEEEDDCYKAELYSNKTTAPPNYQIGLQTLASWPPRASSPQVLY